jgi:peroxiredoxin
MSSTFESSLDSIEAKIGSIAPEFKLTASNDQQIALSEFRGKKNIVLFFIREYH